MKIMGANGRRQRGFSLLEVLIAVIVLSVGLMGMALLQATNLRFTQSANYRTVATNLAYEGLDLVRANRRLRNLYSHDDFVAGEDQDVCPIAAELNPEENLGRWRCQVSLALPNGESRINIVGDTLTVAIRWDDARWEEDDPDGEALVALEVVTTI